MPERVHAHLASCARLLYGSCAGRAPGAPRVLPAVAGLTVVAERVPCTLRWLPSGSRNPLSLAELVLLCQRKKGVLRREGDLGRGRRRGWVMAAKWQSVAEAGRYRRRPEAMASPAVKGPVHGDGHAVEGSLGFTFTELEGSITGGGEQLYFCQSGLVLSSVRVLKSMSDRSRCRRGCRLPQEMPVLRGGGLLRGALNSCRMCPSGEQTPDARLVQGVLAGRFFRLVS